MIDENIETIGQKSPQNSDSISFQKFLILFKKIFRLPYLTSKSTKHASFLDHSSYSKEKHKRKYFQGTICGRMIAREELIMFLL